METPIGGVEEEYLLYNDMRFNWLTHRLAVKDHLALFDGKDEFESLNPGKGILKAWRDDKAGLLAESDELQTILLGNSDDWNVPDESTGNQLR